MKLAKTVSPFSVILHNKKVHRFKGEKRRAYEQHVREVEKGSFTPLVFTTSCGMGKAVKITYK